MVIGRHVYLGDISGNYNQPQGRHESGIGLIPLGDRNRDSFAFGENVLEERVSIDAYEKYLKKGGNK